MMSKQVRFLGVSVVAGLAAVGGMAVYMAPSVAVSTPSQAASIDKSLTDPEPQRFKVAQAQSGGHNAGAVSLLPGGASSLNETYQDWRAACQIVNNAKRCVLSQAQAQKNGQRVLAIELNAPIGNTVAGALVLPFGLALEPGVTFQIDEKPTMQPVPFRTCLPSGCIVNVSFDAPTLVALRAGAVLKVNATADDGAAAPFSISLQGFATALDRVGALSR